MGKAKVPTWLAYNRFKLSLTITTCPILNNCQLDEIDNLRLQHLWTTLMTYFTGMWCKGSINAAPDALSHLICELSQEDMLAEQDEEQNAATSISELMSTAK